MLRRKTESEQFSRARTKDRRGMRVLQRISRSRTVLKQTRKPRVESPSRPLVASGGEFADGSLPQQSRITLTVNGAKKQISVAPWTTLLDALREYLDLTGTKKGCDHGQCGAC